MHLVALAVHGVQVAALAVAFQAEEDHQEAEARQVGGKANIPKTRKKP